MGTIKPKGNYVLVELVEQKKEKAFINSKAPTYPIEAYIVATTEDIREFPPRFSVGDKVLMPEMKGFKFPDSHLKRIISQSDIIAKII